MAASFPLLIRRGHSPQGGQALDAFLCIKHELEESSLTTIYWPGGTTPGCNLLIADLPTDDFINFIIRAAEREDVPCVQQRETHQLLEKVGTGTTDTEFGRLLSRDSDNSGSPGSNNKSKMGLHSILVQSPDCSSPSEEEYELLGIANGVV